MTRPQIVVINDDPIFLDLVQDLVTDTRNYQVHAIQHGMGALERLRAIQPDVILLDVRMEYSRLGFHLLQALRREDRFKQTPVILCSADARFLKDYSDQLSELDCERLEKPFELDELLAKLDLAVARSGAANC